MKRPASVTTLSVLAILTGVVQLLSSFGYFGFSLTASPLLLGSVASFIPVMLIVFGFASLAAGIGAVTVGIGALSLKPWAWSTGLALFIVTLFIGAAQVVYGGLAVYGVLNVLMSVAILGLLSSSSVRSAFAVETGDQFTTQHPSAA